MATNTNIPMIGNTASTSQILCPKCGYDTLVLFPQGFFHGGLFFHNDYTSWSYINCKDCNHTWIQCYVCDKMFPTKQGYDRHSDSAKHKRNIASVANALQTGQVKTRRGAGSKLIAGEIKATGAVIFQGSISQNPQNSALDRESVHDSMTTDDNAKPGPNAEQVVLKNTDAVSLKELMELFGKAENNALFFHQESTNPGSGGTYLLQKAFNLGKCESISNDEQRFVFELTTLLLNMSIDDRAKLAYIIGCIVDRSDPEKNIFKSIRIPRSTYDFDSILLSGKDSIVKNIPRPIVHMTPDGSHAYVRLIDVVAHVLATDTPIQALPSQNASGNPYLFQRYLEFKTDVHTPVTGTIAAKILSMELHKDSETEDILYLFMKEWSDDFDPSHTKSNRAQAWMKTYTISPPTRKEHNSANTCITILGSKGDDHDPVEELFTQDLSILSKGGGTKFYHGGLNKVIHVKAGVLTTCVDRPERTKLFGIGDHNGTYSTCWGVSTVVDVTGKMNCLASCNACRILRLKQYTVLPPAVSKFNVSTSSTAKKTKLNEAEDPYFEFPTNTACDADESETESCLSEEGDTDNADSNPEYGNLVAVGATIRIKPKGTTCAEDSCASWNLLDPHMSFPVPQKFPSRADPMYNGIIPMGRDVNQISIQNETWLVTINLTLAWLESVAQYAYHHVTQHGTKKKDFHWNKQEFHTYCRTCGFTGSLSSAIEDAARSGFPCPIPTRWKRERALEKCHFAAMHMLFLGHVKSNMELFSKWLTLNDLLAKFGRQVNPMLISIRDMRMRRFHALPLSTSSWGTGPWVSENYVFWQRTWKYFMGYPVLTDNPKFDKPAMREQLNIVKRFVASSHACIAAIMSSSAEGSTRMRQLIPIYLDTMVEMDNMIRNTVLQKKKKQLEKEKEKSKDASLKLPKGKNKVSATYVKSNSLGLLAVADAHDYFGSAAMNWEGGEEGERKIQQVKPQMGIRRKNAAWQKLALQKIYTSDSIDWLVNRLPRAVKREPRQTSMYRVYRDKQDALNAINGDGAVSIYEHKECLYLLYRPVGENYNTRSSYGFMEIKMNDTNGRYKFGCWYSQLEIVDNTKKSVVANVLELPDMITKNILALPLLDNDPTQKSGQHGYTRCTKFYLISDDWDERVNGGHFIKSHLTESLFSSWLK